MYDAGFAYRIRRKLAQPAGSAVSVMVVFGILGFIAGMSLYNWRVSTEHDSELVRLSNELNSVYAHLSDINDLRAAVYASATYAEVATRAAISTRADVGQLAEFTRTGWQSLAKRQRRANVPEFEFEESEYMCHEAHE